MMYSYIVTDGERIVACWQTEWDSYSVDYDLPERKTIRIKDELYDEIKDHLEYYSWDGKKVIKKSQPVIADIERNKKDWLEKNTLVGLQNRLSKLEKDNK